MIRYSIFFALLVALVNAHAMTPAERAIRDARTRVAADGGKPASHASLAMALARYARETGDAMYYDQALQAANGALEVAPHDFAAQRARVWILLGKHEFARARTEAEALQRRAPDDLLTYAMLVDAYVELGEYAHAEEAAQWLLDLRPGNVPGLTRVAYLRELYGDIDGAIELMVQAVRRTPPDETEEQAWILSHLAKLQLQAGRTDLADRIVHEALARFPGYHYALAQLARIRLAQGRGGESIAIARNHLRAVPHPENRYELAKLLIRTGAVDEAAGEFDRFSRQAFGESAAWDNANRELIKYLIDYGDEPAVALALAEREISRRRDVYTLDAYAWALHHNRRFARANEVILEALAVGVREPEIFYHAGFIVAAAGDINAAQAYWREALSIAPWAVHAPSARLQLERQLDNQALLSHNAVEP